MSFVKTFAEIGKADVAEAGGKGASLGEMWSSFAKAPASQGKSNPVPPGFVVLASAFEKFLADTDLGVEISAVLDTVDTSAMHTVEHASEKIQKLILTAEFSPDLGKEILQAFRALGAEFVAVRSSATAEDSAGAAWAGQLETYLNTTKEDLLRNIQKCWASLYTPRAIFYGFEKGYHQSKQKAESSKQEEADSSQQSAVEGQMSDVNGQGSISVAVVVQSMVQSEVAGIAFSVHPVTEDHNQLIIEAGYGLGEAVVSGQVTPDSYVVTKEPLEIIDKNISEQQKMLVRSEQGGNTWVPTSVSHPERSEGSHIAEDEILRSQSFPQNDGKKQKLSDEQIIELAKLIVKIEQHYGTPQDIEWAWAAGPEHSRVGNLYITQSRPITTLGSQIQVKSTEGAKLEGESEDSSKQRSQSVQDVGSGNAPVYKKEDYELTFLVRGVSVLVADINSQCYTHMRILTTIEDGLFKQYFTKQAIKESLEKGLKFYSDEFAFDNYKNDLLQKYNKFKILYDDLLNTNKLLSQELVASFFNQVKEINSGYTRLNFESTDLAYQKQDEKEFIRQNLAQVVTFKDQMREVINLLFFEPGGYLDRLCMLIASQFGIPSSTVSELTVEEVLRLFSGWRPDVAGVDRRQEALVLSGDQNVLLEGAEAKKVLELFKEKTSDADGLSGQTANRGLAKGRVKIVTIDYSDQSALRKVIESMQEGQVLVAISTAPELMVACKKASAIITDLGGMMSHAAIVSRELRIPCIVGTKIATQVLHDGDLVEVDADNGVVRVLEKAQKH